MPNVVLLGYGLDQPSYRHRMASIIAPLETAGFRVRLERFPSRRYGLRTWERLDLLRWADVVVLHQIKLSAIEASLVAALSRCRVFDVDDAIYVRKPRRLGDPVDDSIWRRRKFAATCRWVDVVAAGNGVLAGGARPAAHRRPPAGGPTWSPRATTCWRPSRGPLLTTLSSSPRPSTRRCIGRPPPQRRIHPLLPGSAARRISSIWR